MLGGYLLILLILQAHDWYKAEFPKPPSMPPSTETIQHPFYHEQAVEALNRFSRMPEPEKDMILHNLESGLIDLEEWLGRLVRTECQVLCLGELHEETTRQFLSDAFFPRYSVDVLLLEATPTELKKLMRKMEAGRSYFPLLNADIMNVLRSVRNKNPDSCIYGIEETDLQQEENKGPSGSRDRSIATNFWARFRPGVRNIILIGGLHCGNEPNWLFGLLREQAPAPLKQRMLNTWVLEEHQNGALEGFIYFLDEIGVERGAKNFVIPDTCALHPRLRQWFPVLNRQILTKYDSVVVFRR
jgi:hypothetical protein